jgi:cystathionine beta-lyase
MKQHFSNGMAVAEWLQKQKKVSKIIYPPLARDAGYKIWKRDFNGGGAALFTILLDKKYSEKSIHAFVDGMKLFGIGASWGGYESLILCVNPETVRTATKWTHTQTAIRLHIGLEDPADLIADLDKGLKRL